MKWLFPVRNCSGIPLNHHPGAFGFRRKHNFHTGVDLYCQDKDPVFAVEDGVVIKVGIFTGPALGHTWWEQTFAVMVEGATGVVNYGEIISNLRIGDRVKREDFIGNVSRVLFEDKFRADIPGHSCSMLHIELYKHGVKQFADWEDLVNNHGLLDPTPHLISAMNSPNKFLSWENNEGKEVG